MNDSWRGPFYKLTEQGRGEPVANSEASIRRTGDVVEVDVHAAGLTPGNAYTLWLMAFNNPAACAGTDAPPGFRCGPSDMGNPEAGFGLAFGGSGGFAEGSTMEFHGRRMVGDSTGSELGTADLADATGAEVHVRIRDHGPAQPGLESDQVATLMGGCRDDAAPGAGSGRHGDYPCRDIQATGI
jgi:hypothetical protein